MKQMVRLGRWSAWIWLWIGIALAGCSSGDDSNPSDTITDPEWSIQWDEALEPPALYRPWVRWWWPGGDVEDDQLAAEVTLLSEYGFGGAEVQAFAAALDPLAPQEILDRRLSYDTPEFWNQVEHVMDAARQAGIAIDLTLGSGWSSGGMHIEPKDSMKTLLFAEHMVSGPKTVDLDLADPDAPAFYEVSEMAAGFGEPLARYLPEQAKRIAVVAYRKTGGERADNPFVITDSVTLAQDSAVILTDDVANDGTLSWQVPAGDWVVLAFFAMPDGEFPSLIAQPEPGFVVDHFDQDRVLSNLEHQIGDRTGMPDFYGDPLRGFFNDSFELKTERFWTEDFFDEFEARRGYDPLPWLPAMLLPGADNHIFDGAGIARNAPFSFGENDRRLQYDYALTASELFIEKFVQTCTAWAEERGLSSRIQPYGLNIDVIRAAGEAHIPEVEQLYAGGTELFQKAVASGALWYNRATVSSESMVWAGRDHMLTPTKLRVSTDKLFATGVNHILFHGFPYRLDRPGTYGEQGWHAFSSPFSGIGTYSSNIAPSNAFWEQFPTLNRYIARVQYFLRQGKPVTDVAIYFPWLGTTAALGRMEAHPELLFLGGLFGFEPPAEENALFAIVDGVFGDRDMGASGRWMQSIWPALRQLQQAGVAWSWINDHSLQEAVWDGESWKVRGNRFAALVVADIEAMPPQTATAILAAVKDGAPILLIGDPPNRQPGYNNAAQGDASVADAFAEIGAEESLSTAQAIDQMSAKLNEELQTNSLILSGAENLEQFRFTRRQFDEIHQVVFLHNGSLETFHATLDTTFECTQPLLLDAMAGTWQALELPGEISIPKLSSRLMLCGFEPPQGGDWTQEPALDPDNAISLEEWALVVEGDDVGDDDHRFEGEGLGLWTDDALQFCSSPGVYTTTLDVMGDYVLELGDVRGAAHVRINETAVGWALTPPFHVDLSEHITNTSATLEIRVVPPLRNRLLGLGDSGDTRYVQYKGKPETRVPVGLVGPVRLIPKK